MTRPKRIEERLLAAQVAIENALANAELQGYLAEYGYDLARDAALDAWLSNFIAIARIALEEQPQYLEMLGVVEPS